MAAPTHKPYGLCCAYHVNETIQMVLNYPLFLKIHAFFLRFSTWCLQAFYSEEILEPILNHLEPIASASHCYIEAMEKIAEDFFRGTLFQPFYLEFESSVLR